MYISAKIGS